jgi:hypothetical protein
MLDKARYLGIRQQARGIRATEPAQVAFLLGPPFANDWKFGAASITRQPIFANRR